jgi:hypothetical protein
MSDYVTLVGAEQVSSAARSMREAAEQMKHAAGEIDASLLRHQQFLNVLNEWLAQFESVLSERAGR